MKRSLIVILAIALGAVLSCTRQEPVAPGEFDVVLSVGDYPAFEESKTLGTSDPGKTGWENGDVLYIVFQTAENPMAARYRATKKSGSWDSFEKYSGGVYSSVSSMTAPGTCRALAFYAPSYEYTEDEILSLQSGGVAGLDEFLQWNSGSEYDITGAASLSITFVKDYSRIRVVSEAGYTVEMKAPGFVPAGYDAPAFGENPVETSADSNGNAFYYGRWDDGMSFSLSTYDTGGEFSFNNIFADREASADGVSYALECRDSGEYTKISEISAMATKSGKSFDVKVKNAVVSYNIGEYAYLEDGSGAIMVYLKNHGLMAGQRITGAISGTVKKFKNAPEITELDYSEANVSEGADIPCTQMTLAELLDDFDANLHRRILLKDITIEKGIQSGSSIKRTGKISQDGSSIVIFGNYSTNPPVLEKGLTGDLIAFPSYYDSTEQLMIYEADQFTEGGGGDPEDTAFAKLTVRGFYSDTDTENPVAVLAYAEGEDQYSFGKASGTSFYHQLNLENGTYGIVDLNSSSYKIGSEFSVTAVLNGVSEVHSVKVVNKNASMAWLEDKTNNVGYIIALK